MTTGDAGLVDEPMAKAEVGTTRINTGTVAKVNDRTDQPGDFRRAGRDQVNDYKQRSRDSGQANDRKLLTKTTTSMITLTPRAVAHPPGARPHQKVVKSTRKLLRQARLRGSTA